MAVQRFSPSSAARLGKNIAELRTRSGITQDALAEKLEVTTRYLQKLERGIHTPSLALLLTIRKALKTEWSELLHDL